MKAKKTVSRGVAAVAGALTLAASLCLVPSASAVGKAPTLPAPTGPYRVGATSLHLQDTSRPDPWVPGSKARELMVTLWYPTRAHRGPRTEYMTVKESELHLKGNRITGVPYDILNRTRTNALKDVEPLRTRRGLPLVVLSPGFTKPRSTLTGLAEELASRGYVVAGVDHPHENYATAFPDGRIAECIACDYDEDEGFGEKVVAGRSADVSFLLDELTTGRGMLGRSLIDRSRIAMVGQSIGGASAVPAMVNDPRVRAGIDMDGSTYAPIPPEGLSRPFLFLGSDGRGPGKTPPWDRDWPSLTGWKRWLVVEGSVHQTFTDIPLLAPYLGIPSESDISGERSLQITRAYVRAFLDLHLRSRPQPLLERPSKRYPEVQFCSVENKTCA